MSPTHQRAVLRPIELDLSAAFSFERGLGRSELLKRGPILEAAREKILVDGPETACVTVPRQLLEEYRNTRRSSLLGRILSTARRMRETVDRAVLVGGRGTLSACEALFAACCHPLHNELSRGERGGRPRIYFLPAQPDNDRLAGLIDVLDARDDWGMLAIDCGQGDQSLPAAVEVLSSALEKSCPDGPSPGERLMLISGESWSSPSTSLTAARADPTWHPSVLLAGSVMGLDIVALLRGAAALAERFRTSPLGDNPVLDFAGLCNLLKQRGFASPHVQSHCAALLAVAHRYLCPTAGTEESLLVQVESPNVRRDPLRVTMPRAAQAASRKKPALQTLPELAADQSEATRKQRIAAGLPTAVIRLAALDESSIGQLIEWFALSRQIEHQLTTDH